MKVAEVMTKNVVTVDMDDRMPDIQDIFVKADFHHLLVVENNQLKGVITERDLLRILSPFLNTPVESSRDLQTGQRRAHQVMTRGPLTIEPNCTIKEALSLMIRHDISCLPVVLGDELQGIFTMADGVKCLLK